MINLKLWFTLVCVINKIKIKNLLFLPESLQKKSVLSVSKRFSLFVLVSYIYKKENFRHVKR